MIIKLNVLMEKPGVVCLLYIFFFYIPDLFEDILDFIHDGNICQQKGRIDTSLTKSKSQPIDVSPKIPDISQFLQELNRLSTELTFYTTNRRGRRVKRKLFDEDEKPVTKRRRCLNTLEDELWWTTDQRV